MLDLDPGIELEEPEIAAVQHELGSACALVADRAREGDRRIAHPRPQPWVERGRRRLLEHLLVPALDRAVSLAERHDVAVAVGEKLNLDVAGPLEVALTEDRVVAEGGSRLAPRRRQRLVELLRRAHDAHAAPAASGGRLDEEREADLLRRPARQDWDSRCARGLLRSELVAPRAQRSGRRADPREPGLEHCLGELRALGEEPVAGVDRVRAGLSRGAHVLRRVEVRCDLDERVGGLGVERTAVVGRGDGDRLDAFGAAGAEDAQRDLPPVRDEQAAHPSESRLRLDRGLVRFSAVGSTLRRLTHLGGETKSPCG